MPTLNWIGKQAVVNHHDEVPFHLLKDVPELSCGDPGSGNLIVEGDNLIALKALLPYYANQVKCIYIDPPYNTGNEGWVYNDNVDSLIIRRWLGKVVGDDSSDLSRHDKWLCMMYPRLKLLREFLTKDGVIIISIDDFEGSRLRLLMDEIFLPQNFIAQLVWDKTRKNDAKLFSVGHEYLLIYASSLAELRARKTVWRESKPGADTVLAHVEALRQKHGTNFEAIEKELREWYKHLPKSHPAKKLSRHKHVDTVGVWRDRDISWPGGGGPRYDVPHPVTNLPCKVPERGWGFATPESMTEQIAKGLVLFRSDHTKPPFRKSYLGSSDTIDFNGEPTESDNDDEIAGPQVMPSVIHKQAQVSVKLLRSIFKGKRVFENPKDHEVIMRLLRYVTKPGDLILDSFAGSGTTGHAVLQSNHDYGGNRKFILVELEPPIARSITAERVRRVAEGYSNEHAEQAPGLGGGFRYCELGERIFDEKGTIRKSVRFCDLARHVYFTETGEPIPRERIKKSPLLGITSNSIAVYLLYNGILEDKSVNGGNFLTSKTLALLPPHDGPKVVYAAGSRLSTARLKRNHITFKQTPYAIKVK